jgi:excisionase family DNA binding protein
MSSVLSAQTDPLLFRVKKAAVIMGVGTTTIYQLIKDGELEVIHFGKASRITADSIHAAIARRLEAARARKTKSAPTTPPASNPDGIRQRTGKQPASAQI